MGDNTSITARSIFIDINRRQRDWLSIFVLACIYCGAGFFGMWAFPHHYWRLSGVSTLLLLASSVWAIGVIVLYGLLSTVAALLYIPFTLGVLYMGVGNLIAWGLSVETIPLLKELGLLVPMYRNRGVGPLG